MLILSYDFVRACLPRGMARAISLAHTIPSGVSTYKIGCNFHFIRILTEIILIRGIVKAILSKIADKRFVKSSSK